MSITINDIAKMCGVSKSTVSRYLNDGSVSETTAEKIAQVINKTGYKSNFFASSLKREKTRMIGIMLKGIQSVSVAKMLDYINTNLKACDYYPMIVISSFDDSPQHEAETILRLAKQGVDGIILGSNRITLEHIQAIGKVDIPVILVNQENQVLPYCKFNNYQAGQLVGEYVAMKGHQKIVYIGVNDEDLEVGKARKEGFLDYFKYGRMNNSIHVSTCGFTFEDGYATAKTALQSKPTIIVCATDRIAMGVIQYLNEHNYKIPDDISIIGFGDYDFSKVVYPALTTIHFDYEAVSRKVVENIITLIETNDKTDNVQFDIQLIERKSVKDVSNI